MAWLGGWLPPRDQLVYASGSLGFNVVHQTLSLWLVYFYAPPTDAGREPLVPLAWLGLLLGVGRVIEAFDDPAIGHWSDVTHSRWGRRLPFIVAGAVPLAISFVLLWSPPPLGPFWLAAYLFVVLQAHYFFVSVVQQPYEAILAETARAPTERVRVSAWKVTFGMVGAVIGLVGSGALIGALGFTGMAIALGLLAGGSILLSALGIRHLPGAPAHERPLSLRDGLRLTLTNRQFLVLVSSATLFTLAQNLITLLLPYFVTVILGRPESDVALFTGAFALVSLASLPIIAKLAARRTKAFAYRVALGLLVVLLPGLGVVGSLPGVDPTLQTVAYVGLLGAPMAAVFLLPNPLIADVVDDDARRTGLRREGVYFAADVTIRKLGFALSTAVFGTILAQFGFSPEQPLGIRLIGPMAGLSVLAALVIFTLGYRLPDQVRADRKTPPQTGEGSETR